MKLRKKTQKVIQFTTDVFWGEAKVSLGCRGTCLGGEERGEMEPQGGEMKGGKGREDGGKGYEGMEGKGYPEGEPNGKTKHC